MLLALVASASALTPCKTIRASYYAKKFEGRETASGKIYHGKLFTAAHRTLPFGTKLLVTNVKTHKQVTVTVNDRGPFHKKFDLDLSPAAAKALGITPGMGWGWVCYKEIK